MNAIRRGVGSPQTPAVGLVLGAGGVVGQAYQAGVLSALQRETGWDPRQAAIIVGTSAGSVTGAALPDFEQPLLLDEAVQNGVEGRLQNGQGGVF